MNQNQENFNQQESPKPLGILIHSFFVIPFIIAIFSVLLITGIKILTQDSKDVYSYLDDVKLGSMKKRWQSAFELSKILKNPKLVPKDQRFMKKMLHSFQESKHDDPRVRQYLALAMGCTQNKGYLKPLRKALQEKKDASTIFFIHALGSLKDQESSPILKTLYKKAEREEKLAIVNAWGKMGDFQSIQALIEVLKDPEPNITWEAAVCLAQLGHKEGKQILSSMLERSYWKKFKNVNKNEENHAIIVAIYSAILLRDSDLEQKILNLAERDQNLKIRRVAKSVLKKNKI